MSKTGLEKKTPKSQLILWVSSSHILLACGHLLLLLVNDFVIGSMADPDLQIRGGGGGGDPEPKLTRGGGAVSKKFFGPSSGLSLVYKQVGGGGGWGFPPLRMIRLELCLLGR